MEIIKVFNNNIVATKSDTGEELILTGSGLGFQKKIGDPVDMVRIEKIYEVMDVNRDRFYKVLKDTPVELIDASQKIRDRVKEDLNIVLGINVLLGLIDHISYAIERKKSNLEIPNLMLDEIKSLYQDEFKLGKEGVDIIEEATGVRLSEHEAGYITMHIVNASLGENKESISKIFLFTSGIVEIIEDVFDIDFDDDKISLARLNSHLKFLAKRIIQKKPDSKDNVEDFYDMFMKKDKRFKNVIKKIKPFVLKSFDYELSRQECVYLMVHINKVVS
ncbi:MAG: PRD domain-containing protein [Clostridiaceae bacterium]